MKTNGFAQHAVTFCRRLMSWLPRYIAEALVGTVGAGVVGGLFLAGLMTAITHRSTFLDTPLNIGPIIAGAVFAALVTLKFGYRKTSVFVWLAGVLIFAVFLREWTNEIQARRWGRIWDNFFGANCGATDCIDELLATAPLYASIAYSFTAVSCHLLLRLVGRR